MYNIRIDNNDKSRIHDEDEEERRNDCCYKYDILYHNSQEYNRRKRQRK